MPFGSAPLRLAAPALLIEARFRGMTLASRLLRADEARTFSIGDARGGDAPVNPAWLPEPARRWCRAATPSSSPRPAASCST